MNTNQKISAGYQDELTKILNLFCKDISFLSNANHKNARKSSNIHTFVTALVFSLKDSQCLFNLFAIWSFEFILHIPTSRPLTTACLCRSD